MRRINKKPKLKNARSFTLINAKDHIECNIYKQIRYLFYLVYHHLTFKPNNFIIDIRSSSDWPRACRSASRSFPSSFNRSSRTSTKSSSI